MIVQDNIEKVWLIEDNKLIKANKIVSKVDYQGQEFAVLKTERDERFQEMLIKDKNNEYWKMNIAGIEFEHFINAVLDQTLVESTVYCRNVMEKLSKINLKDFFYKKVENGRYFNMCELKYVSIYYPEIYEKAKVCRETIIQKNRQESEANKKRIEDEQKAKVEKVNNKFESDVEKIKTQIRYNKNVESQDLEYYKNNNYENGLTTQNCFLYLAKRYGIKIPLATQGFINNRLVDYDFATGNYSYRVTTNKRSSTKIHEYMRDIFKGVNDEFNRQVASLEQQMARIKGAR